MVDFEELEYKYRADDVKLSSFQELMAGIKPVKRLEVSSWDHYYTNKDPGSFIRFRDSAATPELTQKRKTVSGNNWNRVEVDLPLDKTKIDEKTVSAFVTLLGYEKNFKIFKSCFIYWTPYVNYVYYIVYDQDMTEKGRFMEVEVNKDMVDYLDHIEINGKHAISYDPPKFTNGAIKELNKAESLLANLGITPQNRMKKSLYEMFVK
jgi:adenylate cyclase class IV